MIQNTKAAIEIMGQPEIYELSDLRKIKAEIAKRERVNDEEGLRWAYREHDKIIDQLYERGILK